MNSSWNVKLSLMKLHYEDISPLQIVCQNLKEIKIETEIVNLSFIVYYDIYSSL